LTEALGALTTNSIGFGNCKGKGLVCKVCSDLLFESKKLYIKSTNMMLIKCGMLMRQGHRQAMVVEHFLQQKRALEWCIL
jgi:hypothetical protein